MFKRETKVSVGFRPRRRLLSTPSFSSRACTRLSRLLTCDSDCESCCSTIVTTEALSPDQEYPARFPTTTEPIPARSQEKHPFLWDLDPSHDGQVLYIKVRTSSMRRSSPTAHIEGRAAHREGIIRGQIDEDRDDFLRIR